MALNIVWTDRALRNLRTVQVYLQNKWTQKELDNFNTALDEKVNFIRLQPEAFPATAKRENVRKAVLGKQTTIFYAIEPNQIRILTLWDNRQNPEKLNL